MTLGVVTSVEARPMGSELLTNAAIGATVLNVDMADHFDEDGGQLLLNGALLTYTAIDPDADTITLAAPLSVAGSADDFVSMVEAGKPAVEWIADVAVDDGDPIPAVIPTALIPYFPEGTYDDEVVAEIAVVNDEHQVTSQPQREATLDGGAVWNPRANLKLVSQVIPHDTWTQVSDWTVQEADGFTVNNDGSVSVIYTATNWMQGFAQWNGNVNGRRGIRLMVDGVTAQIIVSGAEPVGRSYVSVSAAPRLTELSVVTVELYQSSGAALSVLDGAFTIFRVSS